MGLLVTVVIWAAFVATALWIPFGRGSLGFVVYILTMACNEIPLILSVVFVASVAATLTDTPPEESQLTAVALGLALLVVLGLVWLQVRARSVRPAFESALTTTLGTDWRARIPSESGGPFRREAVWSSGILLPFQRHRRTVERVRNVPYAVGGRAHLLDIYRRKDRDTDQQPVLIHLHSGGFVSGGKSRESVALLNQLADHGWFCVSANYALRAAGAFPESLVDTKRVIAWVRAHSREHGTDSGRIFLVGASAGGHLAISAALTARTPRFQPGFDDADTSVAGAVSLYGYLGARGADPASAPVNLARPNAPPLLIVHGSKDTSLPFEVARTVADSLRSVSESPVVYVELPDTQHGFDLFASVRARFAADAVESFLEWTSARG